MIEMLGVLAIIGVLSAGGIMGYSAAMENYKVNKTVDMIAKAATAFPQYFVRRGGDGLFRSANPDTTVLCRLNLLPSEICNTTIAGGYSLRKGYFGETMRADVVYSGSQLVGRLAETIFNNDDSGNHRGIYAPVTRIGFYWGDEEPKVGKSACIKIMTSPALRGLNKVSYAFNLNQDVDNSYELPLSMATAERVCVNGITRGTYIFSYSEATLIN